MRQPLSPTRTGKILCCELMKFGMHVTMHYSRLPHRYSECHRTRRLCILSRPQMLIGLLPLGSISILETVMYLNVFLLAVGGFLGLTQ
jgi:hypothetical protein